MMQSIIPKSFRGCGALSDFSLNEEYLRSLDVDPDSSDDTQFGTEAVYCSSHMRIHSAGWCTVSNALKLPVNEDLPQEYRAA